MVYAITAAMFAIATATTAPKAHAAADTYLNFNSTPGGHASSSSAYTVSSWLITVCDALGIR
jgi:hypothetical protein